MAASGPLPHLPHTYRPDVDGLRALAVLAVLAYHAFPSVLPGGFAGVDVFFVISGYLITGQLWRGYAQGKVGLAEFWGRRARRGEDTGRRNPGWQAHPL